MTLPPVVPAALPGSQPLAIAATISTAPTNTRAISEWVSIP